MQQTATPSSTPDSLIFGTACPEDYRQLADVLHASVHAVNPAVYTPAQQEAWAPSPPDYDLWQQRMQQQLSFTASVGGKIVAFMEYTPLPEDELPDCAYIDCTYCLPEFQGRGIVSRLYARLHAHAQKQKTRFLKVDAAYTAVDFFSAKGFVRQHENQIQRGGETLVNVRMLKSL